jgi:hypothetical protein
MTEQLITPVQPSGTVREPARSPRQVPRELAGPHPVDVVDHLLALVEHAPERHIEGSLRDLALAAGCDPEAARHAVASLEPADHVLTVDIRQVAADEHWQLTWAPVSGIVDLMLDWDLHTLEIAVEELSDWLGVTAGITGRALDWLACTPGVTVVRGRAGSQATVRVAIVLEDCPHTAEMPPVAG